MSENKHPAYSLRPDESVMNKLEFDVAIYIRHLEKELQAAKYDNKRPQDTESNNSLHEAVSNSFMTCNSGGEDGYCVLLKTKTLKEAQDLHKLLLNLPTTESNSAEWVAVSERLPEDDKPVEVKVVARYMHYKPKSQQFKQGIKGRWQLHNSYAWNNTNIEITTYLPTPPAEDK